MTNDKSSLVLVIGHLYFVEVENTGFEPVTFCMPCKRASQLRQSPIIFQRQRYTFFLNLPNLFYFFLPERSKI